MGEITWGDTVFIKNGAPAQFRPGSLASVCGIVLVRTKKEEKGLHAPIGSRVFLVEFSDGNAVDVPERWIRKSIDFKSPQE